MGGVGGLGDGDWTKLGTLNSQVLNTNHPCLGELFQELVRFCSSRSFVGLEDKIPNVLVLIQVKWADFMDLWNSCGFKFTCPGTFEMDRPDRWKPVLCSQPVAANHSQWSKCRKKRDVAWCENFQIHWLIPSPYATLNTPRCVFIPQQDMVSGGLFYI
jgi:hypothetical protein